MDIKLEVAVVPVRSMPATYDFAAKLAQADRGAST
jgi:hypothetical protein